MSNTGGSEMSPEQNKDLVRRYFQEMYVNHNLDVIDEIFSENYVSHEKLDPGREETIRGRKSLREAIEMCSSAFPDHLCSIKDMIAEGDKVVTRWTSAATHKGSFMGIPPTNSQVTITGITIDRIVEDKIVETWTNWDQFGLLQQLGVFPEELLKAA
jgi:steroid delta-isomerase-like uncharacterized protein